MRPPLIFRRGAGPSTRQARPDELCSAEQMSQRIRGECARSDRSGRGFSLVLFRVKHRQRFSVARHRVARALQRRCRTTDVIGWFSEQCFCALLPDTPIDGARVFAAGICDLVARTSPRPLWAAYGYPDSWLRTDGAPGAVRANGLPATIDCPGESRADERHVRPGLADARSSATVRGLNGDGNVDDDDDDDDRNGDGVNGGRVNGHGRRAEGVQAAQQLLSAVAPRVATDVGIGAFGEGNGRGVTSVATRSVATRPRPLKRDELLAYLTSGLLAGLKGVDRTEVEPKTTTTTTTTMMMAAPARPAEAAQGIDETPHSVLVRPTPMWKRVLDVVGAAAGVVLLSPVFGAAALGVLLTSGRPIMFRQRRAGLGGEPFWIYKFRTMVTNAEQRRQELAALSEQDGPAFKLRNDPRVTPFGRLLRTTSIDELPQLWNVLKGDMSLVGPRPLPCDESDACAAWQRRRLDVTPGLTCIWQVRGRSTVTFDEWVRMDVAYMRRRTPLHDVWLLLCTVPAVLRRRGAR